MECCLLRVTDGMKTSWNGLLLRVTDEDTVEWFIVASY